jgi:hypothetical protein
MIDWKRESWTAHVQSPPVTERQIDNWSCGIFVMMAAQAFAIGEETIDQAATNNKKELMRQGCLSTLLSIP